MAEKQIERALVRRLVSEVGVTRMEWRSRPHLFIR